MTSSVKPVHHRYKITVIMPWSYHIDHSTKYLALQSELNMLGLNYQLECNMADRTPVTVRFLTKEDLNYFLMSGNLEKKVVYNKNTSQVSRTYYRYLG